MNARKLLHRVRGTISNSSNQQKGNAIMETKKHVALSEILLKQDTP
jgi:hypothetical protein